jgi:phosphopentomutase
MHEASAGKDTVTGHWEMTGVVTTTPMATFPDGFPSAIMTELRALTPRPWLANKVASGTTSLDECGDEQVRTGGLILYTSADSVIQVAAHEAVVPLDELYAICEGARAVADRHRIGRVIARPFVGTSRAWQRTYNRRDFSMIPPEPTLCDRLGAAGIPVVGVGKISDIFAGHGISQSFHSEGNADGMRIALDALDELEHGLLFVNLVDFDMLYGHRNDVAGFANALAAMDAWIPLLRAQLRADDAVMMTADHGNDPTTPGTDHTREDVPLVVFGPRIKPISLGARSSFCDLGQSVATAFGLPAPLPRGTAFWNEVMV